MMPLRSLFFPAILLIFVGTRTSLAADPRTGLDYPLVVCQLPVTVATESNPAAARGMLRDAYGQGARLVRVQPDGTLENLAPGFHSASDPDVSFDGRRLLFAGKRALPDAWNIYELTLDSGEIRQITKDLGDCRQGCYQSSFYQITSDDPWLQITFVRIDSDARNEDGSPEVSSLYCCKLDGSLVQRSTYNLSSDFDPTIVWDGRVLFASWQRSTLDHGPSGRISLLDANAEGTDIAPMVVEAGRRIKHMPCTTPGGLAVFVEADRIPWDGAGQLGAVELRRPLHTYRSLTDPADGLFHSPSPLPDGTLLVSRRPSDGVGTHAVVRFDPASKRATPVFDDPGFHDIQAKLLAPRPAPDGRSSPMVDGDPIGRFYCLDVYNSGRDQSNRLPPGSVKQVRVLEGIPRAGSDRPGAGGAADWVQLAARRILGQVPVESDGSFQLEVPPDMPIQLQVLDEHGLALKSCVWTWTRPRFNQGCVSCHEDPELTPENRVVDAINQPAVRLTPPPEQRVSVGFERDVAPLVAAKCRGCHSGQGSPPLLDAGSAEGLYQQLLASDEGQNPGQRVGRYVHPGRARTSPLVWHVLGRNTAQPWDGESTRREAKPIPADSQVELTGDERQVLIRWIDLGAGF
jgi:hypothetical protein